MGVLNVKVVLLCCRSFVALRMTKLKPFVILNQVKDPKPTKHKKNGCAKRESSVAMLQVLRCLRTTKPKPFVILSNQYLRANNLIENKRRVLLNVNAERYDRFVILNEVKDPKPTKHKKNGCAER